MAFRSIVTQASGKNDSSQGIQYNLYTHYRINKSEMSELLNKKSSSESRKYLLPPQTGTNKGRKTLVLDLDETLVHSAFQPVDNVDIVLPVLCIQNTRLNLKVRYSIFMLSKDQV